MELQRATDRHGYVDAAEHLEVREDDVREGGCRLPADDAGVQRAVPGEPCGDENMIFRRCALELGLVSDSHFLRFVLFSQ